MLENTWADDLYFIGDIVDGHRLVRKKKWNFPDAHTHVLAHAIRKRAQGARVTYVVGNHDELFRGEPDKLFDNTVRRTRGLIGKEVFGISVCNEAVYKAPNGKTYVLEHGDRFDPTLKDFSALGDGLLDCLVRIDYAIQKIPRCKNISVAAHGKKAVKGLIESNWGIKRAISAYIDSTPHTGIFYGHTHMEEIGLTLEGKLRVNDGSCTEHAQAAVMDENGTVAVLTWHEEFLKVSELVATPEGNIKMKTYKRTWKELGVPEFAAPAQMFDDEHVRTAKRAANMIRHTWPSRQDRKRRAKHCARWRAKRRAELAAAA